MTDENAPTRRRALLLLGGLSGTAALALGAVSSGRVIAAPATGGPSGGHWIPIGTLPDFPDGGVRRVTLVADDVDGFASVKQQPVGVVFVSRNGPSIAAYSAICPHLGCLIDAVDEGFHCPCHDSTFARDGARVLGRPNASLRGLDALSTRVSGAAQRVEVEWRRFALGTATKESVG